MRRKNIRKWQKEMSDAYGKMLKYPDAIQRTKYAWICW